MGLKSNGEVKILVDMNTKRVYKVSNAVIVYDFIVR
jgi:hypothetical protein